MESNQVNVMVDGININASHFAKMDKKAAVADMTLNSKEKGKEAMGVATAHGKDAAWAGKAHDLCVEALNPKEAK